MVSIPGAFVGCWHGEHLRGAQNLAKSLVLAEVICSFRGRRKSCGMHERTAVSQAKFVACEWRNSPSDLSAVMVKKIARVKCRIAHKFKRASMHSCRPGLRDDVS